MSEEWPLLNIKGALARRFLETAVMTKYKKLKRIYEGLYVADVEVEFIEDEGSWTPHISMADAYRLDDVRAALKEGDLALATQYGQVYELRPVISA